MSNSSGFNKLLLIVKGGDCCEDLSRGRTCLFHMGVTEQSLQQGGRKPSWNINFLFKAIFPSNINIFRSHVCLLYPLKVCHILAPIEAPFSGIISAHSPQWFFQKEGNLIMLPLKIHQLKDWDRMYPSWSNQSHNTLQQVQWKNKSKMVDEVREILAAPEYAYFPTIYPANKKC